MLLDQANIKRLAEQYAETDRGELVIATTHTQARYALPEVVAALPQGVPRGAPGAAPVEPEGDRRRCSLDGEADIGIATEALDEQRRAGGVPLLLVEPCRDRAGGPRARRACSRRRWKVTLEALAEVADHHLRRGLHRPPAYRRGVRRIGRACPTSSWSARDADVIKTYVELGLGVGIIASMAFSADRDAGLVMLEAEHLFGRTTSHIAVRRGRLLRGYAYRFIELCVPTLTENVVRGAQAASPGADSD